MSCIQRFPYCLFDPSSIINVKVSVFVQIFKTDDILECRI